MSIIVTGNLAMDMVKTTLKDDNKQVIGQIETNLTIDFTDVSREDLIAWSFKNRAITWQSGIRRLSLEQFLTFQGEHTIQAGAAGISILTDAQRVQLLVGMGASLEQAERLVRDPELLKRVLPNI